MYNKRPLQERNPEEAQKLSKNEKWRDLVCSHKADLHGPIHALGLQRNPSRGRTHIFLQDLEYIPGDNSQPRRTRVARCGVYKIQDLRNNIRRVLPRMQDCLTEMVDDVYQNVEESPELVPIFLLILGADFVPDIKIGESHWSVLSFNTVFLTLEFVSEYVDREFIAMLKYDPEWRNGINTVGGPPGPLRDSSGIQDAEFDGL